MYLNGEIDHSQYKVLTHDYREEGLLATTKKTVKKTARKKTGYTKRTAGVKTSVK